LQPVQFQAVFFDLLAECLWLYRNSLVQFPMPWVWPAWPGSLNRTEREKEQYVFYMEWLHKLSCNHHYS